MARRLWCERVKFPHLSTVSASKVADWTLSSVIFFTNVKEKLQIHRSSRNSVAFAAVILHQSDDSPWPPGPVSCSSGKTNMLHACSKAERRLQHCFLRAGAFEGLTDARSGLALLGEHERLESDWQTFAAAHGSRQHPFTSHV